MTLISSLIGFFKGFNKDPFVDKTVKILLRRWFRYAKWPLRTCLRHSQVSKCTQTSYDIGPIFYSKLVQKSNFYPFIICLEIIPLYENQFAITHCTVLGWVIKSTSLGHHLSCTLLPSVIIFI